MTTLRRIIKAGMVNFTRNGLVSWAAVLVLTITLSVITAIILLQAVLHFSLDIIKNKVDVTIYFQLETPEDRILTLKSSLEQLPEVREVTYVSAEENLENFRELHANDYADIQALDEIGFNPLGAYLGVKATEISDYEAVANFLNSDDALSLGTESIIRKVDYYQNREVIDRLNSLISGGRKVGFLVTLLLVVTSIITTFTTIGLAIFISKEEIGVMRLVGASKVRVRGPFMVEGAICGVIATIITLILFWPMTAWLGQNMTSFLGLDLYEYYTSNFVQIFVIIVISGILLGMISSFLAVRRYLDK